jgi:cytochrome c oxidase subunit I
VSGRPSWKARLAGADHKAIGLRFLVTAFVFLLLGFGMMLLMRWQLAYPGRPLPLGALFGSEAMPGGVMRPEFYNQLGAMHGTTMIFLGVVPLAVGGFGNYVLPLQLGAREVAFPRLNAASYWLYLAGGLLMLGSFWLPGGAAQSGWTAYPPLSTLAPAGQTAWLVAMLLIAASSIAGALCTLVTVVHLRAKGLWWMRLPFFVHAQFVTAFLLLLAFPPLAAAAVLQLMDRLAGSSFFLPSGLVVSGQRVQVPGGGSPLLWQHLFWFLAHPEVYVLILPAMGIVAEVLAANLRRPLWGYRAMVASSLFLGAMSFTVWAHHMFLTGMGTAMGAFFQATTLIISVPSVVLLTCFLLSLWGASIRFTVPMLFALGFLPMFALGGLTGLPLGLAASDLYLHDTYYVVGHFHYVVAPGTLFALFAGVYHWYPKATGRRMNETLGRIHFFGSFVAINGVFLPMFFQGLAGLSRRLYDPTVYALGRSIQPLNKAISHSALLLLLFQLPFLWNFFASLRLGKKSEENPWQATTLEWATRSPPPPGNFESIPAAYRGPYEYSAPGAARDFSPQWEEEA